MSADLLRRASTRLRESALAATPGPWTVETLYDGDPDSDWVMWNILGPTDEHAVTPIPLQTRTEDAGNYSQAEADVSYAALVHPPVALAWADLLDAAAQHWEWGTGTIRSDLGRRLLAVARAVLREPEGGDR